ncbi:MmgE/PrpD family protein [Tsuneonella sp. HG222]
MTEAADEVGLSDRLCATIAALDYGDLPPRTVTAARHVLLDAVGVMLGASGLSPEVAPFIDLAAASGAGPSSVLGTGLRAQPAMAALANGAMAHALDFEDAFDPAPGHPNASLIPALIALTQHSGPISGKEFLCSLAAGGDLSCRMGLALRRPMELDNWYPPPIVAAFGAAAGCARLLRLDARGVRDTLSLMLCQATMPGEIKHSQRTVLRAVREAFPAQGAVISALLAKGGVPGFEQPLEGPGGFYSLYAGGDYAPADLTDGHGSRFWIEELTFKPWPSCRGTHPFIEAALDLLSTGIDPAAIERIEVTIHPVQRMLMEPRARRNAPSVLIDAKFSIPFCTALAFVRGRVTLDDFTLAALTDRAILDLASRVSYRVEPTLDGQIGASGAMRVTMRGGEPYEWVVRQAAGAPQNPLTEEQLRAKFLDCAARACLPLAADKVGRLADAILALETVEDVGALFA